MPPGGGTAPGAAADYPHYLKFAHSAFLTGEDPTEGDGTPAFSAFETAFVLKGEMEKTAEGPSPYASAASFDPTVEVIDVKSKFEDYEAEVKSLDGPADLLAALTFANTQWNDLISTEPGKTATLSSIDNTSDVPLTVTTTTNHGFQTGDKVHFAGVNLTVELNGNIYAITRTGPTTFTLDGTDGDDFTAGGTSGTITQRIDRVTTTVDAAETRSRRQHLHDVSNTMVGYFDARAVMTTQCTMAIANLENARGERVRDMEAKLRLYNARERTDKIMQIANQWLVEDRRKSQALQTRTGMQMDISRFGIIAENDQIEQDLQWAVKDRLWDLELFQYHGNYLAAINGAAVMPRAQTQRERLMGAVFTSLGAAAEGATMGASVGGPIGAVAGAGFGFFGTMAAQLFGFDMI